MRLPAIRIEPYEITRGRTIYVVRDDLIPGGTKQRVVRKLVKAGQEYVFPATAYGYAQVALAYACEEKGARCTLFIAERKRALHPLTQQAVDHGAELHMVKGGVTNIVIAAAKRYGAETGATVFPLGFGTPEFIRGFADLARSLNLAPEQVWCAAGSGSLCRALQIAWPSADFRAVQYGMHTDAYRAKVYIAPEKYDMDAEAPPPFPSCTYSDAKVWRFVLKYARDGALMWNVAR